MPRFKLFWSPEGKHIATVEAADARAAIRLTPPPYKKYLGEVYADEVVVAGAVTAELFESKVGRVPVHDDLERTNCASVGAVGHFHCGWCADHDRPRFVCGCLAPSEKQED